MRIGNGYRKRVHSAGKWTSRYSLGHGYAINFDVEWPGERRYVQEDARRTLGWEIAQINFVEAGEVRWFWRAIDIAFENLR